MRQGQGHGFFVLQVEESHRGPHSCRISGLAVQAGVWLRA